MVLLLSWTDRVLICFLHCLRGVLAKVLRTELKVMNAMSSNLNHGGAWRCPFSVMRKYWGHCRPAEREGQLAQLISEKFFFLMGFWIFWHFVIITFPHLSGHFEKKKKFGHEIFFGHFWVICCLIAAYIAPID